MPLNRYYYLVKIQFLGFRYHGWQKQPNVKTVEEMLTKTIRFVLGEEIRFKVLGSSRTDAKVSVNDGAFELFIDDLPIRDLIELEDNLNKNLPPDIRILAIREVNKEFNIIQAPKIKEYCYLFSFGEKNHPYAAPFIANFLEQLDLDLMKEGASLFKGHHNFKSYCARSNEKTNFYRELEECVIIDNEWLSASFFPKTSYMLKIKGKGFLRYQIRLIMGVLIQLGRHEIDLDYIKESLSAETEVLITYVAPASGLHLRSLEITT